MPLPRGLELIHQRPRGRTASLPAGQPGPDRSGLDDALFHLTRETSQQQASLWAAVTRYVDGPDSVPALALWAWVAWLSGDGAIANRVLDRADEEGGATIGAVLTLRATLDAGLPPSVWDDFTGPLG